MVRTLVVIVILAVGLIVGCVGSKTSCLAANIGVSVARTNGSGACPSDVAAGVMLIAQNLPLTKGASCGMDHFSVTLTFFAQSDLSMCQGSDAISIPDFGSDGGDGTDVMSITCANGTSCTETFDTTLTPQ